MNKITDWKKKALDALEWNGEKFDKEFYDKVLELVTEDCPKHDECSELFFENHTPTRNEGYF